MAIVGTEVNWIIYIEQVEWFLSWKKLTSLTNVSKRENFTTIAANLAVVNKMMNDLNPSPSADLILNNSIFLFLRWD